MTCTSSISCRKQEDCHFKRALVRLEPLSWMVPQRLSRHTSLPWHSRRVGLASSMHIYACFKLCSALNWYHSISLLFIYLFFERRVPKYSKIPVKHCQWEATPLGADSLQFRIFLLIFHWHSWGHRFFSSLPLRKNHKYTCVQISMKLMMKFYENLSYMKANSRLC